MDVQNFILPANKFDNVYRLADDISRKKERESELARQQQGKQSASAKFFINYLDDKDKFTGTKYDPNIHNMTATALDQAMQLIKDGADDASVMTAINPLVGKIDKYANHAQQFSKNLNESLALTKNVPGIDNNKLREEATRLAFEGKNIDDVDPTLNYADLALKNGDVYTPEGFDEAFKNAKMNTDIGSMKTTNSRGRMMKNKVKLVGQNYLVSEKDAEGNHIDFVPKYEVATDGDEPLMHEFKTEKGNVTAPVRLLDKTLFDNLTPTEKGYLLQEARKVAKENNVPVQSAQVEHYARALAYDLKNARKSGTYENIEEVKAPQIKIYNNSGGKAAAETDINDIYASIDKSATEDKESGYDLTRMNKLNQQEQSVVLDYAKKLLGDDKISNKDLFIKKEDDGKINVYKVPDIDKAVVKEDITPKNLVGTLPYVGTNVKVNPSVKERQTILQRAKNFMSPKSNKSTKSINAGTIKSLVGTKGYEGYTEQELIDYYKKNGYEVK